MGKKKDKILTIQERIKIGKEIIANQPTVTLEEARALSVKYSNPNQVKKEKR